MRHYLTPLFILLASCSTNQPESNIKDKKLAKRSENSESYHQKTGVPNSADILYFDYNFNKRRNTRKIASAGSHQSIEQFPHKQVYFLTLFEQYSSLKNKIPSSLSLNSCPSFHSSFINYDKKWQKLGDTSSDWNKKLLTIPSGINFEKSNDLALFPELSLPVTEKSPYPAVFDVLPKLKGADQKQELLKKAYSIHLKKLHNELASLCEFGHSDGYYVFENFLKHIEKNPKYMGSTESIQAVFKISVFSNMALGLSVRSALVGDSKNERALASALKFSVLEQELVRRLKAKWSDGYFKEMVERRAKYSN